MQKAELIKQRLVHCVSILSKFHSAFERVCKYIGEDFIAMSRRQFSRNKRCQIKLNSSFKGIIKLKVQGNS